MNAVTESIRTDRTRLLDEANRAKERGRRRRAIALLRQVLESHPGDAEVAVRLAELLAGEGEHFEAWNLFRAAGKAMLRDRQAVRSLAIFREATRCLPFEFETWRITAELERKLGRVEDAELTLREARRHFRSRFDRAQAIELLRAIRELSPWDSEVVLDLARLYAQTDQGGRALRVLDALAARSEGDVLRRVRFAQWQISRSTAHLRLWLRALLQRPGSGGRRPEELAATLRSR